MEQIPEIYKNRARLLKLANDLHIPSRILHQYTKPMAGKSEDEKELLALEIINEIENRAVENE